VALVESGFRRRSESGEVEMYGTKILRSTFPARRRRDGWTRLFVAARRLPGLAPLGRGGAHAINVAARVPFAPPTTACRLGGAIRRGTDDDDLCRAFEMPLELVCAQYANGMTPCGSLNCGSHPCGEGELREVGLAGAAE